MKVNLPGILRAFFVVLLLIAVLIGFFYTYQNDMRRPARDELETMIIPSKTRISMTGQKGKSTFLTDREVGQLLPFSLADSVSVKVNTAEIEQQLVQASPYIKGANAYISPIDRTLNLRVQERIPVIRFFSGDASYYIDLDGKVINNASGAAAYVPVVTGFITEDNIQKVIYPLGLFFHEHAEWRDFFAAIQIISTGKIHFFPRVGDYIFELDEIESQEALADNLAKIPIFYKEIVPKVGANKYQIVKLSYHNQIVCKLRTPR